MKDDVSTEQEPSLEQHIATIEVKENDEETSISDIHTDKIDVSATISDVESNLENVMSVESPVQVQEEQEEKVVEKVVAETEAVKIDTEIEGTADKSVSEILEQNSADINETAEDKVENSGENVLNELHTSATEEKEDNNVENTDSENVAIEIIPNTEVDEVISTNLLFGNYAIKIFSKKSWFLVLGQTEFMGSEFGIFREFR